MTAFLLCALGGCTTVKLMVGGEAADVGAVQTGMVRADIDTLLGTPLFAKGSRRTFYQATYAVAQEYQPGGGKVALGLLMDIMTLGTIAPIVKSDQPMWERPRVVIVYDKDDRAVGLFDAGDEIPADGRSHKRPTGLTHKAANGEVGP